MRGISFLTGPTVVDRILERLEKGSVPESERGPPGNPTELAS